MMTMLYSLISGLMFKIRGGLRVYGKELKGLVKRRNEEKELFFRDC